MNILLTRPQTLAVNLCNRLEALGHTLQCLPMIHFEPSPHPLQEAAWTRSLNTFDRVIFISQAAVQFATPLIQKHLAQQNTIEWIAIGPGTAQALHATGIIQVSVPEPPYETESLLRLACLQEVQNMRIAIVKGMGGRELLTQSLEKRGARVIELLVYQRKLPNLDIESIQQGWTKQTPDLSITTSLSCISHMIQLFPTALTLLQNRAIIVVGARMQAFAQEQGFKRVYPATGADDSTIIKVFKDFVRNATQ